MVLSALYIARVQLREIESAERVECQGVLQGPVNLI